MTPELKSRERPGPIRGDIGQGLSDTRPASGTPDALQLRAAADANNAGMVDLRIPARHQDHERYLGTGLRGTAGRAAQPAGPRPRETRAASQTRDAGLV